MTNLGTRELLLLVIGLDESGEANDSISGVTRLQKFVFLLEQESGVAPENNAFDFKAYKAGPYSSRLYDDLELLENLGLIEVETAAESTLTETANIDKLTFGELIDGDEARAPDVFQERRFKLTDLGQKRIKSIISTDKGASAAKGIRRIKSKYSAYSLRDLLKYVYSKYPSMTTESEIIDEVLGRRRA